MTQMTLESSNLPICHSAVYLTVVDGLSYLTQLVISVFQQPASFRLDGAHVVPACFSPVMDEWSFCRVAGLPERWHGDPDLISPYFLQINVENFNRNSKLSDETFLTRFIVSPCCAPQINWANHPKALGLVVVLVFCRQLMKISILPLRLASSGFSETIQPHSAPYDHSDSQQNDQTSPLFDSSMAPCNSSCHW